ncbi:MAG TPA: PAS domain S-box protein [Candidatus Methylomirabilis sp.]|nr:PAS domain S-box protein [Candidatus Methylomirabilis sp.]
MRPAPTDTVLLIESAEQAAAVMEQISDPARAAGLEVHSSPEEGAIERLKQMVAEGREPVGVVLGPNTKRPLVIARQVYQLTPFVQIIFLAAPGRAAQLQHEMSPTPMIGSNWTVASPDPDALRGLLRDAAASTRQRRQLRTTLDRVNVHVSSRLSADSGEYRKLVISDRYLASILTHAQDAIISTDAHGAVLTWNRAAEGLFGYPESEMVGRSIKMLAADQRAYDLPALIRATQGGEAVVRHEIHCRRADGSSVEVEMAFALVRDDVGRKIGASVIARDITEQRRAEEVLQEMSVALVNAMPGISRVDAEGRYVSVNEVYAHMIGYKPAELIGMDWAPTVHPDDRGHAITAYHHVLSEGKAEFESRAVRKDGSVFHKHVFMVKRVDKEGNFIGHHCFMRDITERKRAEEALRTTERKFRELVESAPDAIVGVNREGRITLVNAQTERLFTYTREELLGQPIGTLVPERFREAHVAHRTGYMSAPCMRPMGGGLDLCGRRKDGTEFPVEISLSPMETEEGLLVTAIIRDITERKRAAAALQAAKEYAETLINSSLNMIISVDANRNIVEFNRAAEEAFGYSKAEVLGEPVDLLYADPSEASQVSSAILKHGGFTGEIRNRRKNVEIFCSYLSASVVRDANGKIVGGMGISWDITERKRAEEGRQALYRASLEVLEPLPLRARLDRLLATARDVLKVDRLNILLADSKGKWLQAVASLGTKEPLEAILVPIGPAGGAIAQAYLTKRAVFWDGVGPVPEELRLKPPYDRIEAFRSRVFANVPLVVQGRAIGVLGADRKHTRQSLEPATRELLQLFAAQAGIAIEHARLYEDLRFAAIQLEAKVEARTRELQAANLRLEEASRFKSEFLTNMSHELRTPLNSIIGFSELLEDQGFGPLTEKQNRYVHNIWTSGRHLLDLINDILDLSKVEAGKIELDMETFSLREALVAALTIVRPQAAKKQISLRSEIVPEMTTVTADRLRLKQIMYNLLSNAIKFTPEGGHVTMTARLVEDAFVEIAVTDTGIGIRAEDIPTLFQEFVQLDSFLGKQHQGTGLGLALSKRLVELHGGQIWVESEGENKGSSFIFTLPISGPTSSDKS